MLRRTGITTNQIKYAPYEAIYIWLNHRLEYPKQIAYRLGRTDIQFRCQDDLTDRLRGYHKYPIVVDHAVQLTDRQRDFLKQINIIEQEWMSCSGVRHRDDGPAIIYKSGNIEWWMNGVNITHQVTAWIADHNLPNYKEWTTSEKVLYKLRWC